MTLRVRVFEFSLLSGFGSMNRRSFDFETAQCIDQVEEVFGERLREPAQYGRAESETGFILIGGSCVSPIIGRRYMLRHTVSAEDAFLVGK